VPICELHQGEGYEMSKHHLIPRTLHKRKSVKKKLDSEERNKKISICQPCHSKIHSVFTEKELEREYNTLEKLQAHPEIAKFIKWVRNHNHVRDSSREMG
jgi:protein-arginine kinase